MEPSWQAAESGSSSGQDPQFLVKVGGSLLDLPDLAARLRELLSQLNGPAALLIGGGAAADAVRDWAATFELDEPTAHWLAVDSLSLTARLVCSLLNGKACGEADDIWGPSEVVSSWAEACRVVSSGTTPLLDPRTLLETTGDQPGLGLPESWAATSDSIAAAVAIRWNVPQLVLVKSVAKPPDGLLAAGARPAVGELPVDGWFPQLTTRLPTVQWCNLRKTPIRCEVWSPLQSSQ